LNIEKLQLFVLAIPSRDVNELVMSTEFGKVHTALMHFFTHRPLKLAAAGWG